MPWRHAQHRVLGAEDRPEHVGLHGLQNAEFGHFVEPRLLPDGPGVVHQRGDPPQFGVDPVVQANHFVLDADIGPHGNRLGTQAAHLLQHLEGRLFVGLVVDADAIALLRGQQRGGRANTATATGDEDDFVHAANSLADL